MLKTLLHYSKEELLLFQKCSNLYNKPINSIIDLFQEDTLIYPKKIFKINLQDCKNNYLNLQKQFHPDLYIQNNNISISKEEIETYSTLINNYYKIVCSDTSRYNYIYNCYSSIDIKTIQLDQHFLEEQFDHQETCSELIEEALQILQLNEKKNLNKIIEQIDQYLISIKLQKNKKKQQIESIQIEDLNHKLEKEIVIGKWINEYQSIDNHDISLSDIIYKLRSN